MSKMQFALALPNEVVNNATEGTFFAVYPQQRACLELIAEFCHARLLDGSEAEARAKVAELAALEMAKQIPKSKNITPIEKIYDILNWDNKGGQESFLAEFDAAKEFPIWWCTNEYGYDSWYGLWKALAKDLVLVEDLEVKELHKRLGGIHKEYDFQDYGVKATPSSRSIRQIRKYLGADPTMENFDEANNEALAKIAVAAEKAANKLLNEYYTIHSDKLMEAENIEAEKQAKIREFKRKSDSYKQTLSVFEKAELQDLANNEQKFETETEEEERIGYVDPHYSLVNWWGQIAQLYKAIGTTKLVFSDGIEGTLRMAKGWEYAAKIKCPGLLVELKISQLISKILLNKDNVLVIDKDYNYNQDFESVLSKFFKAYNQIKNRYGYKCYEIERLEAIFKADIKYLRSLFVPGTHIITKSSERWVNGEDVIVQNGKEIHGRTWETRLRVMVLKIKKVYEGRDEAFTPSNSRIERCLSEGRPLNVKDNDIDIWWDFPSDEECVILGQHAANMLGWGDLSEIKQRQDALNRNECILD